MTVLTDAGPRLLRGGPIAGGIRETVAADIAAFRARPRSTSTRFVAVGRAGFVTGDMLKAGAVVVDVGSNVVEGHLVGDVDFASAARAQAAGVVPLGSSSLAVAMPGPRP